VQKLISSIAELNLTSKPQLFETVAKIIQSVMIASFGALVER